MPLSTDPETEDAKLYRAWARKIRLGILALFGVHLSGSGKEQAVINLAKDLSEMQATADLFGRFRVAEASSAVEVGATIPTGPPSVTPSVGGGGFRPVQIGWGDVTFKDAVEQFSARHPELAETADEVAAVYQRNGFAMAKSADSAVTERVQAEIEKGLKEGVGTTEQIRRVRRIGEKAFTPWTDAYANTVIRNANTTAYSAGTFQQMRDPNVQAVIPALEFDSAQDRRVTHTCKAFHGTIAPAGHEIWTLRTPPCHHGCRSSLRLRDRFSLARQGFYKDGVVVPRIPNQHVRPDPGFGGRTDLPLHGPRV